VARSSIARRPAGHRTGTLDRPFRQHISIDLEPTAASGSGPAATGAVVSASPAHPIHEGTTAEVTPAGFWALLPEAERERLGLRLSRLVLKALRPLDIKEDR
jgi:hypothetical protein